MRERLCRRDQPVGRRLDLGKAGQEEQGQDQYHYEIGGDRGHGDARTHDAAGRAAADGLDEVRVLDRVEDAEFLVQVVDGGVVLKARDEVRHRLHEGAQFGDDGRHDRVDGAADQRHQPQEDDRHRPAPAQAPTDQSTHRRIQSDGEQSGHRDDDQRAPQGVQRQIGDVGQQQSEAPEKPGAERVERRPVACSARRDLFQSTSTGVLGRFGCLHRSRRALGRHPVRQVGHRGAEAGQPVALDDGLGGQRVAGCCRRVLGGLPGSLGIVQLRHRVFQRAAQSLAVVDIVGYVGPRAGRRVR